MNLIIAKSALSKSHQELKPEIEGITVGNVGRAYVINALPIRDHSVGMIPRACSEFVMHVTLNSKIINLRKT